MLYLDYGGEDALREAMLDPGITMKAKAVLAYAVLMGDGYPITNPGLCEVMHEGPSAVRRAIQSLEDGGYLVRTQDLGTGSFTWDWHLSVPKDGKKKSAPNQ